MKRILLLTSLVWMLWSCDTNVDKIASTGKPYEVVVVTPHEVYASVVGDTLKRIFGQEVRWLNQPEPIYDLYNIPPAGIKTVAGRHRNLLVVNISPKFTKTDLVADYDKWAKGQIALFVNAPTEDSAAAFLWKYKMLITKTFDKTERDRMVARAEKYVAKNLTEDVMKKFGFQISIPQGFRMRADKENFLWISNELPLASQGIVIYTFTGEAKDSLWLIKERNIAVNKIPGPADSSYMDTELEYFPETELVDINGRTWYQTQGFWRVKGDFMGGPFINFVTREGSKYIGIDLYVQSPAPRIGKRNLIRQLEALPLTVKFPPQKPVKGNEPR